MLDWFLSMIWLSLFCGLTTLVMRGYAQRGPLRPPGPPGIPLLGNLLNFPTSRYGPRLSQLAATYGNVIYMTLLGQSVVVLETYEAAIELLEKRSANYSDRPRSVMAELVGYSDWVFVLMPYGQKWRRHRRTIAHTFHPDTLELAQPMLRDVTRELLSRLLESPGEFSEHIGFAFAQSMMRLVYGVKPMDRNDRLFQMAETIVHVGAAMSTPGAFLVDMVPPLRYIPSWFPGARFARQAATWATQTRSFRDQLFEAGEDSLEQGITDSLIGSVIGSTSDVLLSVQDVVEVCRGAAATAYAGPFRIARSSKSDISIIGGADTTFAAVYSFFLAMVLNPGAQEKAQAELDDVVGCDRLPEFDDRPSLPYVNALIKEVMRWHVIPPIGVAHRSVADDLYEGYLIPGGSLIVPNVWAMSRDESVYSDPECFRPERFLKDGNIDPNVRDPANFVFGFGRRICPGLHFTDMSLFIACASILHVFRIGPPLDEDGKPVPVQPRYVENSLTSRPEKFGCTIQPRSAQAAQLVRSLVEHPA
ncbi:cytochrome P450 [Cubamyces lactineus]|nr:cytochrome P450 [Cubamyces lactineus]